MYILALYKLHIMYNISGSVDTVNRGHLHTFPIITSGPFCIVRPGLRLNWISLSIQKSASESVIPYRVLDMTDVPDEENPPY